MSRFVNNCLSVDSWKASEALQARAMPLWDFPLLRGCLQPHQVSAKWECSELALFFTALHQLYRTVPRAAL